ncbi:SusF/SusE family outer membrane protein [Sphingobacterium sp. SGG-5]|uniref:SusF/SusE family outer membrane protein n=1 Tax=Sphingobacterium sp. SGG-5 TaxID=2710881 RepID=UPI0013EC4E45|nr:SusF/SusE family outer membrane protein [Sphingobacterium sp. SGG-5]NGM63028.1 SusF/SusE family outer membrane protein [Sphingobacterium sp. SGG-5]
MKKIYSIISLCLMLPLMLISCKDEFGNISYPDSPVVLSASATDIALNVAAPEGDAVKFSWTPGSNFGSNAAVRYIFELAPKGSNFEDAVVTELEKGNTAVIYRSGQLNKLLLEEFGVAPASTVDLDIRVTAYVQAEGIAPQVSEVLSVKVTTYKPITPTLYLIGSATPNGWSADDATKMNVVQGAPGTFIWQGNLTAGEYKFITTLGEFAPSYNRGDDDHSLYFRESGDDPYDVPFVVTEAGSYQVKVNLITLQIDVVETEGAAYSELWFVGGFTGWSFQPMTVDANDPFIFRYHGELNSSNATDEFKIATRPDFDPSVVFLRPETNEQGVGVDLPVVSWSESENSDDYKWKIGNDVYKIKLDLRENTLDIVPFTPFADMYIVGDATPSGWDIGNATPMVKSSDYVFTWTGTLQAGELKFSCDKQSDWNGAWFLAPVNGIEPTGAEEPVLFSQPGSNPDNKWKLASAGTYTITLDQLKETVIIQKQ